MRPLSEWTPDADPLFASRTILAFDLDDTLTRDSELMPVSLSALAAARAAGLTNVLVTGRPAAWADALLRLLPFEGAVAENGSVVFWKDRDNVGNVRRLYWKEGIYSSESPGLEARRRLEELGPDVLARFPEFKVATDQAFRLYDIAFDFAEAVRPALPFEKAQALARYCESRGYSAKVSNIHVNVWKGNFTKTEGLACLVEKAWGGDLKRDVVFTGDSPNDGPLFGNVDVSVGVANVREFLEAGLVFREPKYVTASAFGDGAAELILHRIELGKRR